MHSLQRSSRLAWGLVLVLAVLAGVRLLGSLAADFRQPAPPEENPLAIEPGEGAPVRLTRRMPDAEDLEVEVAWTPGTTVAVATRRAADEPGWESEWRGEGQMAFLESLGGTPNEGADGLNWQFEVNGEYADQGAGAVTLAPGDRVLWKLAPYE